MSPEPKSDSAPLPSMIVRESTLDETRNEYRSLRVELRPRFEEPRQKARTKIRALLTPEQQQKFDALVAQQDAQRENEQKNRR